MAVIDLTVNGVKKDYLFSDAVALSEKNQKLLNHLMTFTIAPHCEEMDIQARAIASTVDRIMRHRTVRKAVLDGPNYFICHLEKALLENDIEPMYIYRTKPLELVRPYYAKFTLK